MASGPFTPLQYDSGQVVNLPMAASATVAKGDALAFASGYVQRATSSTAEIRYISLEDEVTTSGQHPEIKCLEVKGVRFLGYCTSTPSLASHVGTKVDLTDHDSINESATTTHVFFVESVVDATAKTVIGYFVQQNA